MQYFFIQVRGESTWSTHLYMYNRDIIVDHGSDNCVDHDSHNYVDHIIK